jgi:hypothetical protein
VEVPDHLLHVQEIVLDASTPDKGALPFADELRDALGQAHREHLHE